MKTATGLQRKEIWSFKELDQEQGARIAMTCSSNFDLLAVGIADME